MTLTAPKRLSDIELGEVARRIASPMNDDGLRTWYRLDGTALLEEVIALRRERAAVLQMLIENPGLRGYEHQGDPADLANRLVELWTEYQEGVWQRAEVKRIREKLSATSHSLHALEESSVKQAQHIGTLTEAIAQLQAQLADAIADGARVVAETKQACVERSQRAIAFLTQAKEILE